MNKELEALNRIRTMTNEVNAYSMISDGVIVFEEDCDFIKTALERLETFEKELGIDVLILLKALYNGIYVKEHNAYNEVVWEGVVLNINTKTLDFKCKRWEIGKGRLLSMFGKTWALTKEELEK